MRQIILYLMSLLLLGFATSAEAYDVQYGNYYFNRIALTKTQDVGNVMTYYH